MIGAGKPVAPIQCARCGATPEGHHVSLSSCSLNVRGLGMWDWKLCGHCAHVLVHAALAAARPPVLEGAQAEPTVVTGPADPAPSDEPHCTCEVCGRLTLRTDGRCTYHPHEPKAETP